MLVENRTKRPASHFAPLALLFAASAQLVGCDEPEDADEVVTLGEIEGPTDGKSDEIDARAINWKKTGEGELSEGKTDVRATIASVTDDVVVIESDLYIIRPTNLADVKISVDGSLISDIAFMMMYREDSDAEWNALEIDAAYRGAPLTAFLFDTVEIDQLYDIGYFDLVIGSSSGVINAEATLRLDEGVANGEFAVAPIPVGTWGDLDGEYRVTFELECTRAGCNG